MNFDIAKPVRRALLATARESIASRLEERDPCWPGEAKAANVCCGAFVTLREKGDLRGCIGRMAAKEPLFETVREMAKAAAFEDPRFPPLERRELGAVDIEITALSPMRAISEVSEIEIGRHGVHISLGWRSGVFLPQVAVEQGWDLPTLLEALCRKAGLASGAWRDPAAELQVFEGLAFGESEGD